jgi:hypothetical protein
MPAQPLDLLPHYVYELRDPRDNSVFYVGKGTGARLDAHCADEDNAKGERILEIEGARRQVSRVVIGRFATEDEALAVESVLIKWVYGLSNLTNLIHGHRHRLVRGHSEQATAQYSDQPGIDRPRTIDGVRDGRYTEDQRQRITNNQVLEKLESLRDALRQHPELNGLTVSDPDLTTASDPCLLITGLSPASVQIQVKMQLTGKTVVLNLIPASQSQGQAFCDALTSIAQPYDIRSGNHRYGGKYCQTHDFVTSTGTFPRGVPHEEVAIIVRMIRETMSRLQAPPV